MATRGRKPKPAHLRLVDGSHRPTRHGPVDDVRKAVEQSKATFGPLTKPTFLKGHAASAWKQWIAPARWLDRSREPLAIAFCELWAEFRFNPAGFPAAKHTQMRGCMAELGLTDERNRPLVDDHDETDEFFE